MNLYPVSEKLKTDLYTSSSLHVNETVPELASVERVMRFKFVKFKKDGIKQPIMMKNLSDGEQQLLHSLGLCLLFKGYAKLGLEAIAIIDVLRSVYELPKKSHATQGDDWNQKHILTEKLRKLQEQ